MSEECQEDDKAKASGSVSPDIKKEKSGTFTLRSLLFIAGMLVVLAVAGYLYHNAQKFESTDDAFIDGRIISISSRVAGHVARVYVKDNQQVRVGDLLVELYNEDFETELEAAEAKLDSAKATYKSSMLDVDLTSTSSNSAYEQAKANLARSEAEIQIAKDEALAAINRRDQMSAKLEEIRAELESSKLDVEVAKEQHERDLNDLERSKKLVKAGAISKREFEHTSATERISVANFASVQKDRDSLQAQVAQVKAEMLAEENNLRQANTQIEAKEAEANESRARLAAAASAPMQIAQSKSKAEMNRAEVTEAEARVKQAKLNLSYTRIYAPVSGMVTSKGVEQGVFVSVGQSLMAIVPKSVWVTANFKETQLEKMHPGQRVDISVDAYPGLDLVGRVDSIQRGTGSAFSLLPPDNATGNFVKVVQRIPVKIVFEKDSIGKDVLLGPGMSVIPVVDLSSF